MDVYEAIKKRHSVRSYTDKKIEENIRQELEDTIKQCNKESGLNIQCYFEEVNAFSGILAHYGSFNNVKNYIVLIGKKDDTIEEMCGYYGEKIVIKAQQLGLNTCWVGLTYKKNKIPYKLQKDEKVYCVISIGYGKTQGILHKSKTMDKVSIVHKEIPEWFEKRN